MTTGLVCRLFGHRLLWHAHFQDNRVYRYVKRCRRCGYVERIKPA